MEYRFEFDPVNKILLLRFEGRLTDELVKELYWAVRRYSTLTDARAGIWDLSPVTEFAVSPECIRSLADREPAMRDPANRPRFLVAPAMLGLAVSRMVEIAVGHENPNFRIVLSLNEALAAIGVQSPHFEPLESSAKVS